MREFKVLTLSCTVLFATAIFGLANSVRAQDLVYEFQTVALAGDPAPDVVGGTFGSFSLPDINNTGELAFRSSLEQDPLPFGVWAGSPGNLRLVALAGEEPPGAPGRTFASFLRLSINDAGQVVFHAFLDQSGLNEGIWAGGPEALALVARGGELAPGVEPRTFLRFSQSATPTTSFDAVINGLGEVVFKAFLDSSDISNDEGIWTGSPGNISLLSRKGEIAPGALSVFRVIRNPDLNDSGEIVFHGILEDDSVTTGLWFGSLGAVNALAISGDPAPGTSGRTFTGIGSQPHLNNAGEVVFGSSLDSSDLSNSGGIWIKRGDQVVLALQKGDDAPGALGTTFRFVGPTALNEAGDIAVFGLLDGTDTGSDEGIWAGREGNFQLVAREGSEAPGAPGRQFGRFTGVRPALNDIGQVAFTGFLDASDLSNDTGIWVGAPGSLQLVVRESDTIEVRPGDLRTVTSAQLLGVFQLQIGGRQTGFNDSGQVAFKAFFADGSQGILLASPQIDSPIDLLTALIDELNGLDLNPGTKKRLLDKLFASLEQLEIDNLEAAKVNLLEFINLVESQRGRQIPSDTADQLIAAAKEIIALLEAA